MDYKAIKLKEENMNCNSYLGDLIKNINLNIYNNENHMKAIEIVTESKNKFPILGDELESMRIENFIILEGFIHKCNKIKKYADKYKENNEFNFEIKDIDYLDFKDNSDPMHYVGIIICIIIMILEMNYLKGIMRGIVSVILVYTIYKNVVDNLKKNRKKNEFLNLISEYYN